MEQIQKQNDILFQHISHLIEESKKRVKTAIDTTMVYTYFGIGQYIVEDELNGNYRASYGKEVLQGLSKRLTDKYGDGWSYRSLRSYRQFYMEYSNLANAVRQISKGSESANSTALRTQSDLVNSVDQIKTPRFTLSWSHYLILMRIKDSSARSFYEIEARNQDWGVRELNRQINSCLYERLALSRNKDEVMRLSKEGQTIEKPVDVIKDPLTLEFLGLKVDETYSETKLECAIISKMRAFLLELGKGFLFEARQKKFTFDEEHFYVDLVFYNRLLQCYCLIDLKVGKLTHQDLGQMQMYVNYFDRYVKQPFEKPTIGILLCRQKDDALVNLTLPKDANIYASAYELYLPDKKLLQAKVREWIREFEVDEELKRIEEES